ncbi:CDP-alcohol phosphatidyltransferase family protein [Deinococcus sp. KNUC1210]|uniref:CDP-alcohol phosphatidyltransferase family protein n=1 Tax=Deinococcus sp. KNUC1210 TaxID=2917691 RepID=UPI001EF0DDD8|nr:CDP-alcohol phosphatidyltransferase family protein [Deinococcus sp. KNUC1210]ULH15137.1 CDP-alcohol phosphatidyltransferase family protein [Deinococcus sp. KNUC1210]
MSTLAQTRKARPADEWAAERVFRPLAQLLVDPAARLGIRPTSVVMVHTALGVLAAVLLKRDGSWLTSRLTPALLLQVKTVLDNLDGQLARATGQTSEVGRYLDSEMDVVVNVALLTALLGGKQGVAANLLLSFILTVDFLWEREYREARGEVFRAAPAQANDSPQLLAALKSAYTLYFVPQERLLGGLFRSRLRKLAGDSPAQPDLEAWTPLLLNRVAVNLGLSTQLLALGTCILLGRPRLYPATLPVQALSLLALQLWREHGFRAAQRNGH